MLLSGFAFTLLSVAAAIVIPFLVTVLVCLHIQRCLDVLPKRFRRIERGLVWLLLIPVVNLVWNFFVFPKLSESYRAYFDACGRDDVGDCGINLALYYCIASVVLAAGVSVPFIGILACSLWPVLVIVLLAMLARFSALKSLVRETPLPEPPAPELPATSPPVVEGAV